MNYLKHFLHRPHAIASYNQIRWRKKFGYSNFRRLSDPHELAIEHCDIILSQYFVDKWRSIRCAMLSRRKFAAFVNQDDNRAEKKYEELIENELEDIMEDMETKAKNEQDNIIKEIEDTKSIMQDLDVGENLNLLQSQLLLYKNIASTCSGMKLLTHPRGNIQEIEEAVHNEYIRMDAAAILPIIALNPTLQDDILDFVGDPGLFLTCLLQCRYKSILSTDINNLPDIRNIIETYSDPNVTFMKLNQFDPYELEGRSFDKVIINAPSTDDRISMQPSLESQNNIYSVLRKRERARLPHVQAHLICNAVKLCKTGGSVVYSTVTCQALQNEYVIQLALQMLAEENIECELEDLYPLTQLVKDHMNVFDNDLRIGVLITPSLDSNFGPLYFCKINRIS